MDPAAGLPAWSISIAKMLGWSQPGLVIVAVTVVVLLLIGWLGKFLILDLPYIMERSYRNSNGAAAGVIGVIFFVVLIVAFILNIFVVIAGILGILYLAGTARNWWHKGD